MPISFSRREQSAMHIPKEWSLHLAPDRLWKFRGRAGAAHPVWKVPEQGWKLTLGLERNLTCENPDAHGAKWHAITLTVFQRVGHSAQLPSLPRGATPDQETNSLMLQRGREAVEISLSRTAGAPSRGTWFCDLWSGWKNPALFPARHSKSLVHWDLNTCMNKMQPCAPHLHARINRSCSDTTRKNHRSRS